MLQNFIEIGDAAISSVDGSVIVSRSILMIFLEPLLQQSFLCGFPLAFSLLRRANYKWSATTGYVCF